MAETQETAAICTRCEENPLDREGTPKWCGACRAKYQREYRALQRDLTESRGFSAGVAAMRAHIAAHWGQWPSAVFSGTEIRMKTMQLQGPNEPTR